MHLLPGQDVFSILPLIGRQLAANFPLRYKGNRRNLARKRVSQVPKKDASSSPDFLGHNLRNNPSTISILNKKDSLMVFVFSAYKTVYKTAWEREKNNPRREAGGYLYY